MTRRQKDFLDKLIGIPILIILGALIGYGLVVELSKPTECMYPIDTEEQLIQCICDEYATTDTEMQYCYGEE